MSNETIAELRTHLFAALRGLSDRDAPLDLDRAKAVAEVSQVIINSAKVEVDYIKATGSAGSGFIPDQHQVQACLPELDRSMAGQLRVHRLRG